MANVLTTKFQWTNVGIHHVRRPQVKSGSAALAMNKEKKGKKGEYSRPMEPASCMTGDRHSYIYDLPAASNYKQDASE